MKSRRFLWAVILSFLFCQSCTTVSGLSDSIVKFHHKTTDPFLYYRDEIESLMGKRAWREVYQTLDKIRFKDSGKERKFRSQISLIRSFWSACDRCGEIESMTLDAVGCYKKILHQNWEHLPKQLYFSKEFVAELNFQKEAISKRINQLSERIKELAKQEERRRREEELRAREEALRQEKEALRTKEQKLALKQKQLEKDLEEKEAMLQAKERELALRQDQLKKENSQQKNQQKRLNKKPKAATPKTQKARAEKEIDRAAKKAGYAGYSNKNIILLIYETQKKGGLEKYLNTVVGCPDFDQELCNKWYPKLKILQVLDGGLLYSFSEFAGDEYFDFIIYVDEKEPGKIYQEGQSIENTLYVFKGMFSYPTSIGTIKTVPAFSKAKME